MKNLIDYVMVDNLFTSEQCQEYISVLDKCHWGPHRWYNNAESEFKDRKDFDVSYNVEVQTLMKDPIMNFFTNYVNKHNARPNLNFSGIRFNKYNEGEGIVRHVDHIHSLFDGKKRGIPIMTCVGVFNDDYEGGEFMMCGEEIKLKQGDAIQFPSVFLYPHEVKPVTKGTRYSWVLWTW